MATEIKLPNDKWVRSSEMPWWSICLDPDSGWFGYKFCQRNGQWVASSKSTPLEIERTLKRLDVIPSLQSFAKELNLLLERLRNDDTDSTQQRIHVD